MATCAHHYQELLGPIYLWMVGGAEAALHAGAAEIDDLRLLIPKGALAVDLGAGFGMHAIPLAQRGAEVIAIDASNQLIQTLVDLAQGLKVHAQVGDLTAFSSYLPRTPQIILCMGDTITHLADMQVVENLIQEVSQRLERGGIFVVTFRDYSSSLMGDARFIPVRSDASRILTCFLEEANDTILVHDILHERIDDTWTTRVSHYRKLRLAPRNLIQQLESRQFRVRREAGMRGMVRLVCERI